MARSPTVQDTLQPPLSDWTQRQTSHQKAREEETFKQSLKAVHRLCLEMAINHDDHNCRGRVSPHQPGRRSARTSHLLKTLARYEWSPWPTVSQSFPSLVTFKPMLTCPQDRAVSPRYQKYPFRSTFAAKLVSHGKWRCQECLGSFNL